jgi:hypothetical protein
VPLVPLITSPVFTASLFYKYRYMQLLFSLYDVINVCRNRERSVDIPVRFPAGAGNISLATASGPVLWPTHPPIQWVPGVKRLGREADNSLPCRADVKNAWRYTSIPPTSSQGGA